MELGIFSRTYETNDLEETYRRMKAHGIVHTQFNLLNAGMPTLPEDFEERKIEEIKMITDKHRIALDALSGTFNMIDPDIEARKRGCSQFEKQCRIARLLNIPIVSLCTGSKSTESKWKWHEDNEKQSSWDDLMRSTETILKYAEDNHIILGVETEASNIINTPEKARKYLDTVGSPNIKIIMDGANLFHDNQASDIPHILREAFDILGKDIVLAHAKDFSLRGDIEFVAAGRGILDFKYYISLLNAVRYKGALIMHGLSEEQVPASKQFLEEAIANA
ncbi:MAG: sugar phosphate isomerase/epimerase [Clostridiales bacterium]|nr:sugar phosphate isomerase/epimerase [Clostridiales bacterium]